MYISTLTQTHKCIYMYLHKHNHIHISYIYMYWGFLSSWCGDDGDREEGVCGTVL
jgi:hypothetical protein